ncbi:MAG: hypothetical protein ABR84_06015 [Cryomorphaceae bacterium BACL21 MAG-121220-bin10]|jgi:FtsH-binding integral membrane protein|nr:MAG: hypothetical protein ABR84_06015 [Cryomorphaceae bacterium BACL21 MAG-121220-bin10]|tara:strand:+ start:47215 stop:47619 length:405 start_codon:yes stop_codon:yes gene_type:complete
MNFPTEFKQFAYWFTAIGLACFCAQSGVQSWNNQALFSNQIITTYFMNFGVGILLVFIIAKLLSPDSTAVGSVFLLASAVKFGLLFLLVLPNYKSDGVIDRAEFWTFFMPYMICVIMEVLFLSKRLTINPERPQ